MMAIRRAPAGSDKPSPETDRSIMGDIRIIAGKLFDPESLEFLESQVITVSEGTGLINDVQPLSKITDLDLESPLTVDLRGLTVLPGFVDTHVHFFLHPYSETTWNDQLTKESLTERTVRATNHARVTLLAGFTTVRDLGTEGAEDADIALRKCISGKHALIPGPRYFCANRAIVSTGSYGPKSTIRISDEGIEGITGAAIADGTDECRKVVRRQVGSGADWIKMYMDMGAVLRKLKQTIDYRVRSRVSDVSEVARASIRTFTDEELQVMINTAHFYGLKVAAHSSVPDAMRSLIRLGVDSIEHGYNVLDERIFAEMREKGTIWVPTLSVVHTRYSADDFAKAGKSFGMALKKGVRIACGGDTGVFPHGENALEMKLMVRLGAPPRLVLRWGTLGGWECTRPLQWEKNVASLQEKVEQLGNARDLVGDNEVPFGLVRRGFAADLIATTGNLDSDFEGAVAPSAISFVMKLGRIYKRDGSPINL